MVCYHPIIALDDEKYKEKTGTNKLRFVGRFHANDYIKNAPKDEKIEFIEKIYNWTVDRETGRILKPTLIPCGKCIGCRLAKSREWAIRVENEAKMYESNRFVTLTYDNKHLPRSGSLNPLHVELFIKRLRDKYGSGIKYLITGEYGAKYRRPHYHCILFNVDFGDEVHVSTRDSVRYTSSKNCEKLWGKGFVTIGDVNFASAAYVSRYVTKKIYGDAAADHYGNLLPEFQRQSTRPGIGSKYFEKYYHDIYDVYDKCITSNGLKIKPPRYYDKLLAKIDPELYNKVKEKRSKNICEQFISELNDERFFAKETIQNVRFQKLIRVYEELN